MGILARDVTQETELERRRDEFVAVASHELRTPMTTILGFSELLLHREPPAAERREWVQRIHDGCQKLAAIVDDLLNVSRIQSGRMRTDPRPLPLREIVEDAVAEVRPITQSHEFVVDLSPGLPKVMGDADKLGQVLRNLLTNAVKYSPNGGPVTMSARHEPESRRVVVSVADRGIGISREDQATLFSTFQRIKRPETESVGGTGLGLYIVKGFLELMQGEVWLESEVNKGSTFFFSLPAAR